MKRILVSVLLVFTLVISSICSVGAENYSLEQLKDFATNIPVQIPISIAAKTTSGEYSNSLSVYSGTSIDLKATLDLNATNGVKEFLTDAETKTADGVFDAIKGNNVSGSFTVNVNWGSLVEPEGFSDTSITIDSFKMVKADDTEVSADSLFNIADGDDAVEVNTDTNTATIKIVFDSGLTLETLKANCPKAIYLEVAGFKSAETVTVTGTIDATTSIVGVHEAEESINYNFTYTSAVVSKRSSGGGGGSVSTKPETTTDPETGDKTTVTENKNTGTTTTVIEKTDGSTTTVVEKKDGTTTTTEKDVQGTVTETVEKPDGSSTTSVEKADGSTSTTIADAEGYSKTEVELSEKATDTEKTTVELPMAPVKTTNNAEKASVVNVKLPENVTAEAPVNVVVPVENVTPGTVAVLVNEDGTTEVLRTSVTTENGVALSLTGSATIQIIDNSKDFVDTDNHWAKDSIDFATSREIFKGTSETTFEPETGMTRAMFTQVLHNIEYNPEHTFDGSFHDVEEHHWYEDAVHWAADEGIVTGYANGHFGPEDTITREQLAAMLWRYAGKPEASIELNFTDADKVHDYAKVAMMWAVENGIINGTTPTTLSPGGIAIRAQVATMLQRFCALAF